MARTPRKATADGKANKAGRRRGVNPLALVVFLLVLGAGAGVVWLSLTYQPPVRPGMPGNDLVLELSDETKAIAKPKAETEEPASDAPAKDDHAATDAVGTAPGGEASTAHGTDDQGTTDRAAADNTTDHAAAKRDDDGSGDHRTSDYGATDQAAPDRGSEEHATASADHGTQADGTAHGDAASDSTDDAAATDDSGKTAPADRGTDQATDTESAHDADQPAPAPQGQPQRQPVGQQTAMRLNVPQPSPGVRPRVAVVLTGLGLSKAQTNAAIQALPANITFAFSPYGNDLQHWADRAREAGHEVLLELPMEPHGFPNDDPGPHTLLTSLTEAENIERMTWVLDRFTGYVGVTSQLGGRFTTQPEALRPILVELKKRGLLFLDTRASPDSVAGEIAATAGLAHAANDLFLDEQAAARATIQAGLAELERLARERGSAIGIGYPFPVTMEMLSGWARDLEGKDIELLPVSALARLPEAQ